MANIDIEMSEFTKKTTLANDDFIVGTLSDGKSVQIKVSDLASVVAAALLFSTTLVLTSDYRCDEVLKASKLSFISVATDITKEYMDYSSVITIPCGYYAVQVNVSDENFKIRKGYYDDKNVITWYNWLVLKQ